MKLRCRLGLHKWVRVKVDDPHTADSGDEWITQCKYCRKPRRFQLERIGGGTGV